MSLFDYLKESKFYKPQSIKGKFLAIVLPPVFLVFLLVTVISGCFSYFDMKKEILRHIGQNGENYAKALARPLWNLNHEILKFQVKAMLNNPDISGVKVVEKLGGSVFTAGDKPDLVQLNYYFISTNEIVFKKVDGPRVIGTLTLYSHKNRIYNTLIKRFFRDSFLFWLLVCAVIGSAMFANHQTVILPLIEFRKSIRRFIERQEYKPVEWATNDELGEAISAYNGLLVSLEMSDKQAKYALEKAKKANQIKSEFLANMSHEIRTPLNGVMGMTELLMDSNLSYEQKNLIQTIQLESESLLIIINDILDFSKIEAGKLELEHIPFDLRTTLEDLSATLAINASNKGIELIHFLEPGAPKDLIGDPSRLRQVFMNLAGNAVKFTHEGEVFIKGTVLEELEDEIKFLFAVRDTGIGIPPDKQDTIFDSFSQADGSTTRKYGGTGLGITISKMLVERMEGTIGLTSEEGRGTEFWFTVVFKKQKKELKIGDISKIDFSGMNMLVVDDIKTNRDVLTKYLKSWGCNAIVASSGTEAVSILEQTEDANDKIDVIFIDFQMPSMNGFDLSKQIKQMPYFNDIPIILLTSMGMLGDGKKCKQIGIEGYLTKPIRQGELKNFTGYVLGMGKIPFALEKNLVTRHTLNEARINDIHVLLVEDYETNQRLAVKQLENAGFMVTLAEHGQKAVEYYSEVDFDIILMDIQMPIMDGYQATSVIRKMETEEKRTPIIAMTAHAIQGYREQCIKAGMDDYITKPLRKAKLLAVIQKWVKNKDIIHARFSQNATSAQNPVSAEIPIDIEKAYHEFDDDQEFFLEVYEGFMSNVQEQIGLLKKALADSDFSTVHKEAHAIKGGAANLAALPLSLAAADLEKSGRDKKKADCKQAYGNLCAAYNNLKNFKLKASSE